MPEIKDCRNCGYSYGRLEYLRCMKVGTYCSTHREFLSRSANKHMCDESFSGWHPIEPPPLQRRAWWRIFTAPAE